LLNVKFFYKLIEDLLENDKEYEDNNNKNSHKNQTVRNDIYFYEQNYDNYNQANYIRLDPKIENKRHKSAGDTRVLYNPNYLQDMVHKKQNYFDDNNLIYGNKISFNTNKQKKLDYAIKNNQGKQQANFPIINFEINNNVFNPEPKNYNQNLPIENAIQIRKNNNENNRRNLQLEVPEAKNYILTSTDIVNYGTKTNQSKPINDLKRIYEAGIQTIIILIMIII